MLPLRRRVAVLEASAGDLVFPSTVGTLQDPTNYRKAWRKALEGSELEGVTPYVLRKTVGTLVARAEGVAAASAQLGHSSERVTSAHYVERLKVAPDATAVLAGLWTTGNNR